MDINITGLEPNFTEKSVALCKVGQLSSCRLCVVEPYRRQRRSTAFEKPPALFDLKNIYTAELASIFLD